MGWGFWYTDEYSDIPGLFDECLAATSFCERSWNRQAPLEAHSHT